MYDLGKDVEFGKFVEEHRRVKTDIVDLSTLMTGMGASNSASMQR